MLHRLPGRRGGGRGRQVRDRGQGPARGGDEVQREGGRAPLGARRGQGVPLQGVARPPRRLPLCHRRDRGVPGLPQGAQEAVRRGPGAVRPAAHMVRVAQGGGGLRVGGGAAAAGLRGGARRQEHGVQGGGRHQGGRVGQRPLRRGPRREPGGGGVRLQETPREDAVAQGGAGELPGLPDGRDQQERRDQGVGAQGPRDPGVAAHHAGEGAAQGDAGPVAQPAVARVDDIAAQGQREHAAGDRGQPPVHAPGVQHGAPQRPHRGPRGHHPVWAAQHPQV
mmetsp:Transcript_11814/g.29565  ORF Transcript_11814/g.29565 Transcript_11814/m.29565 type:complete len:279 (-) Transcript_11814:164-1000(-)